MELFAKQHHPHIPQYTFASVLSYKYFGSQHLYGTHILWLVKRNNKLDLLKFLSLNFSLLQSKNGFHTWIFCVKFIIWMFHVYCRITWHLCTIGSLFTVFTCGRDSLLWPILMIHWNLSFTLSHRQLWELCSKYIQNAGSPLWFALVYTYSIEGIPNQKTPNKGLPNWKLTALISLNA